MHDSRPVTPEAPPQDLWSSILDSVSSSRSTPSKQILILGQPSTGKSSLAAALLQKPVSNDATTGAEKDALRGDFALGYDFGNVKDDADEDTLARLSIYTVPSAAPAYMNLLPHFLPPRTSLSHTLIMIVLDWTRPWTFVDDLHTWLGWIENWAKGDGARELEIVREECRERLQSHLQHYTEPNQDPIPTSTSALSNTVLPLSQGTLTHNFSGVPIVVVCSKADLIDESNDVLAAGSSGMGGGMVKGKGDEWEERTDGIMQVLRTICLKYGAALFYTTLVPTTLQVLRQYALHLLFAPPAPAPGIAGAEAPAPIRNPFPFKHKPNTLDRDKIVIPAGWDSWGKISVLRDSFEAKTWGEAWDRDLDAAAEQSETGGMSEGPGARNMFASLVPDQGSKAPPLPGFNKPMPEQDFLAKHYDENRDPRGLFKNSEDVAGATAGIVGPMGSSSLILPNVERVLTEMEVGMGGGTGLSNLGTSVNGDAGRKAGAGRTGPPRPARPGAGYMNLSASAAVAPGRAPGSPPLPGQTPSPSSGGKYQPEVLAKFFENLLSSKDRVGAGAPSGGGNPPPAV